MTKVEYSLPIAFEGLSYEVGKEPNKKTILKDLFGCFRKGQMTALMGPSGCGKTSLMDVIAGRKNTGTISGTIRFGGAACAQQHLKHLCGYVEQFDNLVQVSILLTTSPTCISLPVHEWSRMLGWDTLDPPHSTALRRTPPHSTALHRTPPHSTALHTLYRVWLVAPAHPWLSVIRRSSRLKKCSCTRQS